ncbi:Gfo/Idh/MocA family protein [Thaumasiovibrio subtropicus]|uniref:Gfo/Idh/MocA family protein n=1 Tax=Thaumasiovibrio subtropicus TaxID=1891207 RepID=UPI000B35DB4D|nr:Gfo/Idh/MocA family oxidoreductase [Thaumasiovibrio subtropicus]
MGIIRWGIIGCGNVAQEKTTPAFQEAKGAQISAVMARNLDRAEEFAIQHHIPNYFDNVDDLITAPFVDALYIATPPDAHLEIALKVADAKKPCCIEKPFGLSFQQSRIISTAFEKKGLPLFVSYYRRLLPKFQHIKALLDQQVIGPLSAVDIKLIRPAHERDEALHWRIDPQRSGGGYFTDLGSHMLDLLHYLIGEIIEVDGIAVQQDNQETTPNSIAAHFRFNNNVLGSGLWHFDSFGDEDVITLYGDEGTLQFSVFKDSTIILNTQAGRELINLPHPKHVQLPHIQAMQADINGKAESPCRAFYAERTNWVIDQILGR